MRDLNQTIIIGRLTKDPELTYTPSGKAVCKISIANNQGAKEKPLVNFFDVQCWEKLAENIAKYMKKGNMISVCGDLQQHRWDKDGKTQSRIIINAHEIQFLSSPVKTESAEMNIDDKPQMGNPYSNDDDIPF
jgi:single-strand DNA-binding protein